MPTRSGAAGCAVLLALWVGSPVAADSQARPISGSITSIGSDSMRELMGLWADALTSQHPGIAFDVQSPGSATAPAALIEGRSRLAPMSRPMTDEELADYRRAKGREPFRVRVGYDALAVYVHRDNPLRGLSIEQLDGIFSRGRVCGGVAIERWGDVVFGSLADRPIEAFGRNALSGTHAIFRERVLCGGEFEPGVRELPDSAAVVAAVGASATAIGYAGLGYRDAGVRVVAIARDDEGPYTSYFVEQHRDDPDPALRHAHVISGRYPLSRPLFVYVDRTPRQALPPELEAFLRLSLSERGQALVERAGFVPLPPPAAGRERRRLSRTGGRPGGRATERTSVWVRPRSSCSRGSSSRRTRSSRTTRSRPSAPSSAPIPTARGGSSGCTRARS